MVDEYSRTENKGESLFDDDAISYVSADSDLDDDDDDDAMTNRSTRTLTNIRSDVKVSTLMCVMGRKAPFGSIPLLKYFISWIYLINVYQLCDVDR